MSQLKLIHTDILIIMIDDVNQRARAGEFSDTEYASQIAPLNSELYQRTINLFNEVKRQSEITVIEAANNVRQIYARFIEYKNNAERVIDEFNDFITATGLDETFEDWHNERIQKLKGGSK